MELVVSPNGSVRCVYDEALDLALLGRVRITRGSHVEPDKHGKWLADLNPVGGRVGGLPNRIGPMRAAPIRVAGRDRATPPQWVIVGAGRGSAQLVVGDQNA